MSRATGRGKGSPINADPPLALAPSLDPKLKIEVYLDLDLDLTPTREGPRPKPPKTRL